MDRSYDVVVFGATGVTGKFVVEELARHAASLKLGIAGRNKTKLYECLLEVADMTGLDLTKTGLIVCDVKDLSSINHMCLLTKVIINCVGPYRFYGEDVVASCISNGTHYIDVCGEPQFLEDMQQKYFKEAFSKDVYVIGSCGFDSVPCDMSVEFLRQKFVEKDEGATICGLNSVESYLEAISTEHSKINFGTWQSAIHSVYHASELKGLRKKLRKNVFPDSQTVFNFPQKRRPLLFKSETVNKWCLPFMGSDKSVVYRSQMFRKQFENEEPVQIQTYFCVSSFLYALFFIFMAAIFLILSKFKFGRFLLEEYPSFFLIWISFQRTSHQKTA